MDETEEIINMIMDGLMRISNRDKELFSTLAKMYKTAFDEFQKVGFTEEQTLFLMRNFSVPFGNTKI